MIIRDELKKLGISMDDIISSDLNVEDTPLQTIERIRKRIYG